MKALPTLFTAEDFFCHMDCNEERGTHVVACEARECAIAANDKIAPLLASLRAAEEENARYHKEGVELAKENERLRNALLGYAADPTSYGSLARMVLGRK